MLGSAWRSRLILALLALLLGALLPATAQAGESSSVILCPTIRVCYISTVDSASETPVDPASLANSPVYVPYISPNNPDATLVCPTLPSCIRAEYGTLSISANAIRQDLGAATWQAVAGTAHDDLLALTCPTALVCLLPERDGTVLHTADGGRTWLRSGPLAPPDTLGALACATATACYLLAHSADGTTTTPLATRDGGQTWRPLAPVQAAVEALACPTTAVCYASIDTGEVLGTRDGGLSWRHLSSPWVAARENPRDMSCPAADICFLAITGGAALYDPFVAATSDGGRSWRTVLSSAAARALGGARTWLHGVVSCPSPHVCYVAAGGDHSGLLATVDGGRSWRLVPSSFQGANEGSSWLRCPTVAVCYFAGTRSTFFVERSADGGRTWQAILAPLHGWVGISCPTAVACVLVDSRDRILKTGDGGASWHQINGPTLQNARVNSVACGSATACVSVGEYGAILITSDGGSAWQVRSSPTVSNLVQVACVDVATCHAVGEGGVFLATTDAGASWAPRTSLQLGASLLEGVALLCPVAGRCLAAAGQTIARTTDGGRSWALARRPAGESIVDLACPSAARCYAIYIQGSRPGFTAESPGVVSGLLRSDDGGITWRYGDHTGDPSGTEVSLIGLSCPEVDTCFAVGEADSGTEASSPQGVLYETTDGGATLTSL